MQTCAKPLFVRLASIGGPFGSVTSGEVNLQASTRRASQFESASHGLPKLSFGMVGPQHSFWGFPFKPPNKGYQVKKKQTPRHGRLSREVREEAVGAALGIGPRTCCYEFE